MSVIIPLADELEEDVNIAIVDDSLTDSTLLLNDLKRYAAEKSMAISIYVYRSGEEFITQMLSYSIDVVFLDIYMEDISGMGVAEEIRRNNINCNIVFVTSSTAHAIKSYDVDALHYILKPYDPDDIYKVMDKLEKISKKCLRYIKVKEGREWRKVMLQDILYVDYSNHYIQIHTSEEIISTYMKFPEIEAKLLIYKEFLSCYRCIVVNMNKIKKSEELFFMLYNGEYVPINRKRAKEIKARYIDYLFGLAEEQEA